MARVPLILEIKGNSLDDGPGIRTVVFFKGCPLSCVWCHNPEGRSLDRELSFDATECVGANGCLDVCDEGALDRSRPGFVDRERCSLCLHCIDVCPSGALSSVGREMTVDEIVEAIAPDRPFFASSGGGVTLSGGEPTLFLEFAGQLARQLFEAGVHVLLETAGAFDIDRFDTCLYPHLDLIYYDLKVRDPALHRRLCGVDNRIIFENFTVLFERSLDGGVEVLPRVPLVPGLTATRENLTAIAEFLRGLGATRIALLPYNPTWPDKMGRLGLAPTPDIPKGWMSRDEIERCREAFLGFEIDGGFASSRPSL